MSQSIQSNSHVQSDHNTPQDRKRYCKCKRSRCVMLYCECFAYGMYCEGCSCSNCRNNAEHESARQTAIEHILERKANAFWRKKSPDNTQDIESEAKDGIVLGKRKNECRCRRSSCLKRYCECFRAGVPCSTNCKCKDCKNFEGCRKRHRSPQEFERIDQEIFPNSNMAPPACRLVQPPQVKSSSTFDVTSPSSVHTIFPVLHPSLLGSSEFNYRSLLAGIIKPEEAMELCSTLVVVSDATNILEGKYSSRTSQMLPKDHAISSRSEDTSECQEGSENQSTVQIDNRNQVGKTSKHDMGSSDADTEQDGIMPPHTVALRCDEKDTLFNFEAFSEQTTNHGLNTDVYGEQERLVLAKFRDFLTMLITRGSIKETQMSLSSSAEMLDRKDSIDDHIIKTEMEE